jgi:hypothetical protein
MGPIMASRSGVVMLAEKNSKSRREFVSVFSASIVGAALAQPSEALGPKFEPKMSYGRLPVPVYGAFDGYSVGNKYHQPATQPGKTIQLLGWMRK